MVVRGRCNWLTRSRMVSPVSRRSNCAITSIIRSITGMRCLSAASPWFVAAIVLAPYMPVDFAPATLLSSIIEQAKFKYE